MSRKDYEAFAKIIANARRQNTPEQACDHIVEDIADYLHKSYKGFLRDKFIEACE